MAIAAADVRIPCRHPSCQLTFHSHASMLQHYTNFSHSTISTDHSKPTHANRGYHPPPPAAAAAAADLQLTALDHPFHPCDLCPRFFKSAVGLHDHLRAFHLTTNEQLPQLPVAPPLLNDQLNIEEVSCNDCGRTFKTTDSLHQHQWDAPDHTRVAASRNPNHGTRIRKCSQCDTKLPTAEDLDQHFVEHHPISEVPELEHDMGIWQLVEARFRMAWTKPTIQLYKVHRIFKVYNPGWRRRDFEEYRKELKREMSDPKMVKEDIPYELRNKIRSNGNELLRYHGTTVKCKLGRPAPKVDGAEKEAISLCTDTECSLCRILETGFMTDKCRINRFQRYGKGIYCSQSSSKSSAYVKCSASIRKSRSSFFSICFGCSDSSNDKENYKVMMVCRVLAGRPFHTTRNLQHLKGPPHGFHSVQGDPGEALNYDELVIYNDHAILPAFIILYTSSD